MNTSDPAAPVPPQDPVVATLRTEAAASVGHGAALVTGGLLAGLALAFVLTVLLWLAFGLPGLGFTGWCLFLLLLYAGGAVAWLRQRPTLLGSRPFGYVDPRQEWAGLGGYPGVWRLLGPPLDLLFLPARMTLAGVEQGRGREPVSRERFFDRCALLLRQLGRRGEAMTTEQVFISDEETDGKLSPVLNYLDRSGWIGLSSDRSRIWLSGRAKETLPRLGVVPDTASSA